MGLFSRLFHRRGQAEHPACSVIVAAAGSSSRMGGENKLLQPLEGVPVLAHTLMALNASELVDEIVVAAREEDLLAFGDLCKIYGVSKPVKIVRGGTSRLESVYLASLECREDTAFLAVHDGARPLVTPELIDRTIALAHRTNAAAPAVPVKDTIKIVQDGRVTGTPGGAGERPDHRRGPDGRLFRCGTPWQGNLLDRWLLREHQDHDA